MKRFLKLLIFMLAFPALAQAQLDTQGHRGARGLKPENTLPAFETALDLGVATLELDLHFTADEVVVIWHDDYIGGDKCGLSPDASTEAPDPDELREADDSLFISQLTFEQLQAYRCDRNPGGFAEQDNDPTALAGDDYGIATLEELFAFVDAYADSEDKTDEQRENAAQVEFNIETKRKPNNPLAINDGFDGVNAGQFELAILEVVEAHDLVERVVIQSFDHRSLWAVREENASVRLAALTFRTSFPNLADYAERGATIWSPDFQSLSPDVLSRAHEAGLLVIPWTVNDPDDMQQLIEMGVDGIISDRPDLLLALEEID